jgi:hypothetical protein
MAIVKCTECNGSISSKAAICPHSGVKFKAKTTRVTWFVTASLVFGLLSQLLIDKPNSKMIEKELKPADITVDHNLPQLTPFNQMLNSPYQYIDKFNVDIASDFDVDINDNGNVVAENKDYRAYFETKNNVVRFVEIQLKRTSPCIMEKPALVKSYLAELGFIPEQLIRRHVSANHIEAFKDNARQLNISVYCVYQGGPIVVAIVKA